SATATDSATATGSATGLPMATGKAEAPTALEGEHLQRSKSARAGRRAHIPNETRRQVVARDGLSCCYMSPNGRRCGATAFLQLEHEQAWAKLGADTAENLRIFCAKHNQLRAEHEYGARQIERAIVAARVARIRKLAGDDGVPSCDE